MSAKLDLILFGATGFTGKFCIEHLLQRYCSNGEYNEYTFGLAARNMDKLKTILNSIPNTNKNKFELIECDALNPDQIKSMVLQTKVIISTVGPYCIYAENLIKSCAENGVDYIDLSGEAHWVRNMALKYDKTAMKSQARIVNFAGVVCALTDCAVYACIKKLKQGEQKEESDEKQATNYSIRSMIEAPMTFRESGGSAQSILNTYKQNGFDNYNDKRLSYQLCPADKSCKYSNIQPQRNNIFPQWNVALRRYETGFFYSEEVERMVLCKTNHLLHYLYGETPIIYQQTILFKSRYYIIALMVALFGLVLSLVLVEFTFVKPVIVYFMERVFPVSGDGPFSHGCDREVMLGESWKQHMFVTDMKSEKGIKVEVNVYGDYGYFNTAKLLVEQGIIFTMERKQEVGNINGGFLTPAIAFGQNDRLIKRLNELKQFDIQFKPY